MLSNMLQYENLSFFTGRNAEKDALGNLEVLNSQSSLLFQSTDVILDKVYCKTVKYPASLTSTTDILCLMMAFEWSLQKTCV